MSAERRGFPRRDRDRPAHLAVDHRAVADVVRFAAPEVERHQVGHDVLTVRSRVSEIRSRSLRFIYEIHRPADDTLLAEGETLHLVTDQNQKVRTIPDVYKKLLIGEKGLAFPADKPPS